MKMKSIIFILLLSVSNYAFSAWHLTQPQGMDAKVEITDSEQKFMLGDLNCGVTAVLKVKDPDGNSLEIRELYCQIGSNTTISVLGNCRENVDFPTVALQVKHNDKSYLPSISCH